MSSIKLSPVLALIFPALVACASAGPEPTVVDSGVARPAASPDAGSDSATSGGVCGSGAALQGSCTYSTSARCVEWSGYPQSAADTFQNDCNGTKTFATT